MIRLIVLFLFFFNMAHASSERYYIQLGSFKNLRGLEKSINHLPQKLRSHVVIVRSNGWFIPFAYYVPNKRVLYGHVSRFKRYFPDAHIAHSSYMLNHPVVRNYVNPKRKATKYTAPPKIKYRPQALRTRSQPTYQNIAILEQESILKLPLAKTVDISTPIIKSTIYVEPKVEIEELEQRDYKKFNKQMLSGKHYYLAYKSTKDSPDLLIKVSFQNHTVVYQPIIGDMKMTEANYLIDDNRLYMFANNFTKDGAYSILEESRKNHFLVSSWIDAKKLNTLRYYYDLNDAKEYLGLKTSKGLASILEEGDYDEYFLDNN